jgi:Ribbon-helix-helix protein, copG family
VPRLIRVQVQLDPQMAARLRELSKEENLSIAALIRRAVDTSIAGTNIGANAHQRWERSLSVLGRFAAESGRPGPPD